MGSAFSSSLTLLSVLKWLLLYILSCGSLVQLDFKQLSILSLFWYIVWSWVQPLSSACGTICWKDYFSPLNCLYILLKTINCKYEGLFLDFSALFQWSIICLSLSHCHSIKTVWYCLDYWRFVLDFIIEKYESYKSVLPFQDYFGYFGLLAFPYEFWDTLLIFE